MPADLYRHLILAVDPGLRGCGCALFGGGELKAAGYVPGPKDGRGPPAHAEMSLAVFEWWVRHTQTATLRPKACFVEFPQVYPDMQNVKGGLYALNDLLDVAGVASSVMTRCSKFEESRFYLPREWKGSIKADQMLERIKRNLTTDETRSIVGVGSKDHNTLDAIGIGLAALNRLNRKVYPT